MSEFTNKFFIWLLIIEPYSVVQDNPLCLGVQRVSTPEKHFNKGRLGFTEMHLSAYLQQSSSILKAVL